MQCMGSHITVLKDEAVASLTIKPDSVVVDATVGSGGHTTEILKLLGTDGMLIGFDADKRALTLIEEELRKAKAKVHLKEANFS